jgi:hypothetical protein
LRISSKATAGPGVRYRPRIPARASRATSAACAPTSPP